EQAGQAADPTGQQLLLLRPFAAVGVGSQKRPLGEHIQAGEQAQARVAVEVVDVAAAFLVHELQQQQAEQRGGGGNDRRAGVAGAADELLKAQRGEQGQEQEHARQAAAQATPRDQAQGSRIGSRDGQANSRRGWLGGRTSAPGRVEKGGGLPAL